MCHDLSMLGTSHMRVSGDRVKPDEWTNNRQEPPTKALVDLYSKRSHDQCMCSAVTSHVMSQHHLMA